MVGLEALGDVPRGGHGAVEGRPHHGAGVADRLRSGHLIRLQRRRKLRRSIYARRGERQCAAHQPRGRQEPGGKADVLFLDVRKPPEVRPRAWCRGLVEFRANPASAMQDKAFDRAKTAVAYCASGGRSALVGGMGYDKVLSLGGFKGWVDAGGEAEKG